MQLAQKWCGSEQQSDLGSLTTSWLKKDIISGSRFLFRKLKGLHVQKVYTHTGTLCNSSSVLVKAMQSFYVKQLDRSIFFKRANDCLAGWQVFRITV